MSGPTRWNPLGGLIRSWGHFVRRPRSTQIRTVALVVVVLVGTTIWVATSPSASSAPGRRSVGRRRRRRVRGRPGELGQHLVTGGAPSTASTWSSRWCPSTRWPARKGSRRTSSSGSRPRPSTCSSKQINDTGGSTAGRSTPSSPASTPPTRPKCGRCARPGPRDRRSAFAVLDGLGDWTGDNQLCITQEGHTPFIGQWTTVTNWTNQGSPYLWWTGPDQATILQAVVNWGLGADLLGGNIKVGVIAGDRASDQVALDDYLLPDLRRAGVTPVVETIDADPDDTATTEAEAPLVVQQLRSAGVDSVIPLMPFNVFYPVLQAETSQQWFPKLLLSDYEESIESALGLLPVPYATGARRSRGRDHRDSGRGRRRPTAEPGRLRPRPPQVLDGVAQGLPPDPAGQPDRLHRGAGPHRRLVPGHPPLRHGGEGRRPRSQPSHLRHGHVQDHRLPGHRHPGAQLRPQQALRARRSTRWSGCTSTRRRLDAVQDAPEQDPPVHVLGRPCSPWLPLPTG